MAETIVSSKNPNSQQVVVMDGEAFIRDAAGKATPIAAGATLQEGQVIFTSATGHVTLMLPNGQIIELGADRSLLLDGDLAATQPTDPSEAMVAKTDHSADQILNALNAGKDLSDELDATAAGLNAGSAGDEGSSFVRLLRIVEAVDPLSFNFASGNTEITPFRESGAGESQLVATEPTPETPTEPVTPTPTPPTPIPPIVTLPETSVATPSITTNLDTASVSEGGAAVFTLTLSNPSVTPTEVTLNLLTGGANTASAGDVGALEYFNGSAWVTVTGGKITVPANETSVQVRVPTIQDGVYEGRETFQLQATVNGQTVTGNGSIVDDGTGTVPPGQPGTPDNDQPHVQSIGNATATEGNALVFDVKLDHSSTTPTTVTLNLQSGTGTVGVDTGAIRVSFDGGATYVAVNGNTISVPANTTDLKVQVATVDDALLEGSETVTLGAKTQYETSNALVGTGTITDDAGPGIPGTPGAEDTVLVSLTGPASVTEGNKTTPYTVTLTQAAASDVTVQLTYSGTATDGSDYIKVVSVTIPKGSISATFDLQTLDDALVDGGETIQVSLGAITGGGFEAIKAGAANSVTTTIADDAGPGIPGVPGAEDTVLVSLTGPATVLEGNKTTPYTVTLTQVAASDVTVQLTYSGTATDGSDYTKVVSVTIPKGSISATFDLQTLDDALVDGGETIQVSLGAITGGGFEAIKAGAANTVTTTIADDAGPGIPGVPGAEDTVLVSLTGPASVTEGNKTTPYTVTLTQAAASDVTVQLTYSGTATDGSDYTKVVSVTIPKGSISATFDLQTLDDALVDGGETIQVSLGAITGGGFEAIKAGAANSVTTTINDDAGPDIPGVPGAEDTVLVSLTGPATVTEGNKTTPYTVTLTQAAASDVTVQLTYSGTATDGSDYTKVVSVTIPKGSISATFDLQTLDDTSVEGVENIQVSLGAITGGGFEAIKADPTHTSVSTDIVDNDTASLSITPALGTASVSEGSAAIFTLTLSNPSATPTEVTLNLLTGGANSASGSDVGALEYFNGTVWTPVVGGKITVPANETSVQVRVPTVQDGVYEGRETFQLQATVNGQTVTGNGSIVDDGTGAVPPGQPGTPDNDQPHVQSIGNATATEGNALVFDVKLDHSSTTPTTVTLNLQSGTGTVGVDTGAIKVSFDGGATYVAVNGNTISVPANTTDLKVQVATIDDALLEGSETVTLGAKTQFETSNALVGTGTITDDAGPGIPTIPGAADTVLVSLTGPATVTEGNKTTPYTVTLTQAAASDVTVQLTYSGTATDGSDYTKVVSVTIPKGSISATFDLQTLDDALVDGGETIQVSLGAITGGGFEAIKAGAADSVTTTINDDAGPGIPGVPGVEDTVLVSLTGPATVTEGNKTTPYTVSLTQAAASDVTVQLTYSGTATDGSDYTKVVSVTIPKGSISATFDLQTLDDALVDGGETIQVSLGAITGGGFEAIKAGAANSVTTNINDDAGPDIPGVPGAEDTVLVSLTGPATVTEGNKTTPYTVTLTQAAASDVTVQLTYSGTATDGSDYTKVVSVTIPKGSISATFDLQTLDDTSVEGVENIQVSLGAITGGGFEAIKADPTHTSVSTDIVDNDTASLSITPALGTASVSEGSAAIFTLTLSNPSATPTEVTLNLLTGGANSASGSDVGALEYFNGTVWTPVVGGKITVPANETSVQVRVPTVQDGVYEGKETFQLQATVNGQTVTGNGSIVDDGTGTVPPGQPGTPDNDQPHVQSIGNATATEGNALVFDVKLDHSSTTPTTVTLNLQSGTGTVGVDTGAIRVSFDGGATYVAVNGNTISVPANTTDLKVQVATIDDALLEGSETVTLGAKTQYETSNALTGTGTITDDAGPGIPGVPGAEDTVLVSLTGPATVLEGNKTTPYTVTLTQAAASDVTVQLTYSGTATDGSDYTKVVSVTIPKGSISATFDLQTLDDTLVEGVENIQVSLGTITGGGFEAIKADPAHTSVSTDIVDNDSASLSITPALGTASVSEGSAAVFTLTLSSPSATPTEVTLNVLTGGANSASGSDVGNLEYFNGSAWVAVTGGKITVPANETSVQVRVPTIQDGVYEGRETFQLQATVNGQTVTGNGSIVDDGTGTVPPGQPGTQDNDQPHVQSIGNATATEGNALVFDVKLDHSSTTPTTVTLNLQSGTGTVGVDTGAIRVSFDGGATYVAVNGNTISVPANTTDIKVQVATIDDALLEGSETVTLGAKTQFETSNALVGTGTITDDAGPGIPGVPGAEDTVLVSLTGPASVTEGNKTTPYTVTLTQAAASDVTVQLTYSGTATDGSDYTKVVSVTIPKGSISATFDLQTLSDALLEGNETIQVSLGTITGGGFEAIKAGAANSVTTTIADATVNQAPDSQNVTATGLEDQASIAITLTGTDSDGTVASFRLGGLPANGLLYKDAAMTQLVVAGTDLAASANQLTLYFKPDANWNGSTTFQYAAKDNLAVADATPATATINVTAVNDAAVIGGTGTGQVQEDTNIVNGQITTGGQLTISDVDGASERAFVAQTNTAGTYGSLSIDSTGKWTYTLNNSAANVQALNTADHKVETFTVKSVDGTSSTITVNVDGLNEPRYNTAPIANDDFSFTKTNVEIKNVNVLANDSDLQGDKLTIQGTPTVVSGQGTVTVNADGTLNFKPTTNWIGDAQVSYTISDGYGGTATAIWTIKVVPPNNVLDGSSDGGVGSYFVQGPESGAGNIIDVSTSAFYVAGGGAVAGQQYSSSASSGTDQIILTGGSNDHVEAGAGNDLIYMGETQDYYNSVIQKDQAFFLNSNFMNTADNALSTSANNDKLVQSIVNEMQPVADLANAGSGNDTVFGENGSDALFGGAGNDKLYGGNGIDALRGGAGHDLLVGGAGDDVLRGDSGSDVFKWSFGDQGSAGAPAHDIVMDFNNAKSGNLAGEVDKLDLRDLLQGENSGNLTQYLHFEKSGNDTIVHISTQGLFDPSNAAHSDVAGKEDQIITLQGFDLTSSGSTDQAVIQDLLSKGRLLTD